METQSYEIPSVPTSTLDLNDQTGLKKLAGWLARYHNFGLSVNGEVSPLVRELLDNGTLAGIEPSLTGLRGSQSGGDEEYERYEFDVCIEDFVNINGYDWANLHFVFMASRCMMFIECCNQSKVDRLSPVLAKTFNAMDVDPLLDEEFSRDLTWKEADEIILRYLKYMKNPEIVSVPE